MKMCTKLRQMISTKRFYFAFSHPLSFSLLLTVCLTFFIVLHLNGADGTESGRLFVWGENQFGQLATGTTDIVTKPSCVKVIKNLGYKVRTIAFGEAFSVILTGQLKLSFPFRLNSPFIKFNSFVSAARIHISHRQRTVVVGGPIENSKVFFNGKSIFALNESLGTKLWHLGNGEFITRQNFEIVDFQKQCADADGNLDDLVDVVAGGTHFVALTSNLLHCHLPSQ